MGNWVTPGTAGAAALLALALTAPSCQNQASPYQLHADGTIAAGCLTFKSDQSQVRFFPDGQWKTTGGKALARFGPGGPAPAAGLRMVQISAPKTLAGFRAELLNEANEPVHVTVGAPPNPRDPDLLVWVDPGSRPQSMRIEFGATPAESTLTIS